MGFIMDNAPPTYTPFYEPVQTTNKYECSACGALITTTQQSKHTEFHNVMARDHNMLEVAQANLQKLLDALNPPGMTLADLVGHTVV